MPAKDKIMDERNGRLIVFEGTDGTGKSTQLTLLATYLQKNNYPVVVTREPTTGQYGKKIRALYQNRANCTPREELELFLLDRKEHVDELIVPSLKKGKIVLCDRYYLSTIAYQGAIGFDVEELINLNDFAPDPDLALLFYAPITTSSERITGGRGELLNDFEQLENLEQVAAIFKSLTMPFIEKINALGTIEEVHMRVQKVVAPLLKACNRSPDIA